MKITNAYNSSMFNKDAVLQPEQISKIKWIEGADFIEIEWEIITLIVLIIFTTVIITTTIIFICYHKCCKKFEVPYYAKV